MYTTLLRPLLFKYSPETAHKIAMFGLRILGFLHRAGLWPTPSWSEKSPTPTPFGNVRNPVGLAAGLDKNAQCLWGWQALGFGFVEVGTVTPRPQPGNPKPRLFRYHNALVNRMGFNNDGVHVVAERIRKAKKQGLKIKVGGNIGKNFFTSLEDAARDYTLAAMALRDVVDYLVINVSSPNTPGLRDLQNEESLEKIISQVKTAAGSVPVFVKVAPDNYEQFSKGMQSLLDKYSLAGIICGNTLASHDLEKGGLSGAPIFEPNLKLCRHYAENTQAYVIGVGGITSPARGRRYMEVGARLVQIYTGLIYEGPKLIRGIIQECMTQSL